MINTRRVSGKSKKTARDVIELFLDVARNTQKRDDLDLLIASGGMESL